MFRIHIRSITDQGLEWEEQTRAALLPLLKSLSRDGSIEFIQPVHAHVHATTAGETILLDGEVKTLVRMPCSRCLEPFDLPIQTQFSVAAGQSPTSPADEDVADEIELDPDQIDVMVYSGDSIDLRDEIAQQVVMALPVKPLCREACKGLCSGCGVDLNQSTCQCPARHENSPFAVLKRLPLPPKQD